MRAFLRGSWRIEVSMRVAWMAWGFVTPNRNGVVVVVNGMMREGRAVVPSLGETMLLTLPKLSERDNCIFVQPNQEAVESIEKLSRQSSSSSVIALLNPQWRDVDDAFDAASKNDGVFGALASFLGGKGSATRRLGELGYVPTYTLEGYVCRGGNVRMVKRYDSEWVVYAERDKERGDYTSYYVELGRSVERPRYQDVEAMLDEKGISYKYARDLGMAPKL
mmetsp:Transcript_25640/g.54156  ORF Transcript_25640/g.54156 Transcript_25640/m.54156 type:complete len:221 (+) Transcript_25640:784-1446(+)